MPTPRALTHILTALALCAALTAATTEAAVTPAAATASACNSFVGDQGETRGTCSHTTNLGNDWWQTWENCYFPYVGTATLYGNAQRQPNLQSVTKNCGGNITAHGINHN